MPTRPSSRRRGSTPSTPRCRRGKVQSAVGEAGTTDFDVDWSGTDTGSGVASYTVYVSDSGAAYTVWQPSTTGTTAAYTGVSGHSYAFYVIATDGAGNVEPAKSAAEGDDHGQRQFLGGDVRL